MITSVEEILLYCSPGYFTMPAHPRTLLMEHLMEKEWGNQVLTPTMAGPVPLSLSSQAK